MESSLMRLSKQHCAVVPKMGDGVRPIWNAPTMTGNVTAYALPRSRLWELDYDDAKRVYNNLPNHSFLDVYQVDPRTNTYRRLVHVPRSQ
jgi:hypothetical protein